MCGVAGLYSNSDFAKNKVDRMLKVQWHRGPDGSNSFQQDDFYAGMVRLAINDVENGQQPFVLSAVISRFTMVRYTTHLVAERTCWDGIPSLPFRMGRLSLTLQKVW